MNSNAHSKFVVVAISVYWQLSSHLFVRQSVSQSTESNHQVVNIFIDVPGMWWHIFLPSQAPANDHVLLCMLRVCGKNVKQIHAHYSPMNNIRRWNASMNKSKAMERHNHDKTAQWTSSNTIDRTQSILKINNIFLFIYFISFLLSCTISSTYISCTM